MTWTKKELRIVGLLSLVLFFVALAGLEIALSVLRPGPIQRDALLGWKLKENFQRELSQSTLGQKKYQVSFATNADGLRVFGASDKAPIKILVLGDSFTMDPYASNGRMWYAKMAERLAERTHRPLRDFYVLAGGGGGWGTYQNLLLSERLSRTVRPNLLILQFCSNDFQNNSYEWEKESVVRGQFMRRPFASLNTDVPKYAPGLMGSIYRSFIGESRLFSRIDGLIGGMQFRMYGGYTRPLTEKTLKAYENNSVSLTRMLLTRLREKYRAIPAVMVNCDGDVPGPNKQWKAIARDSGFIPLNAPSDFLHTVKPEARKEIFHSDGSHLSDKGNQLYGAIVADELAALDLVPLHSP